MRSNQRIALFFALFCIISLLAFNFTSSASRQGKKEKKAKASANHKTDEPRQSVESTTQKSKKTGEEELRATEDEDADDPDLPPGMAGRIDKEAYLRARGDYINLLRGRTEEINGEPREQAIQQMEKQEALLRERARRGLASPVDVTNWTFLGPAPIPLGQTSTTRVPVSGRTISIAVHPTDPNTVYVGTAQGGLYKSINGGTNWTRLFDFQLESLAIGAVTIDPVDSNTVYVGTGEPNLSADSFAGKGLYIIRNANSVNPTIAGPFRFDDSNNNVLGGRAIGRIVVNPNNNNVIFVCTTSGVGGNPGIGLSGVPPRGIYRSTNAQSPNPTFSQVQITGISTPNDRNTIDLALDPANPNLLIATVVGLSPLGDGGIYRTTNALDPTPTFTRTLTLPDGSTNGRAELYLNRNGSSLTIYAATGEISTSPVCTASTAGMLRRSTDGGLTWSNPLPGTTGFCGGQCFYDMAIVATPDNQTIHLGGAARGGSGSCLIEVMKRSTNGGTSFVRNDNTLHADEHALAIAPSNPQVVYTGSDGGIWKSVDNGTTWTSLNNTDFSATQFQGVTLHPYDRNFLMGGTQDNGTICRAADGTFTHCQDGDGGYALIDSNAQDATNVLMYHTFFNQRLSQLRFERATSTAANNLGILSWTSRGCAGGVSNNGISCTDNVLFYAPMALGPGNPNTVYYGSDRLYRSTNRGDTNTVVSQAPLVPSTPAGSGVTLSAIAISPQDDNVRIVGLTNGKVFATTTGSTTMTDVTGANFPVPNRPIGRVAIDPNHKNTAYITLLSFSVPLGQQIFKTTNLNDPAPTWAPASNGIPQVPVNGFVVDPQDSNSLYAGTDVGVYHSTDGGANWMPYGLGLPRVAVFDVQLSNVQRVLRIATHGRGIWEIGVTGRQFPVLRNGGATLIAEGCAPGNGAIDPNEDVTVSFAVTNIGPGATQNLMVTLQSTGGVTFPDAPQSYGMVDSGATASRNFRFSNNGTCGGTITLTFHLQDGDVDLGNVSIPFTLGLQTATAFTEDFDGVTVPALPIGWSTDRSSTATNTAALWVTSNTASDTVPNSAFGKGGTVASHTSLTSPVISIPSAPGFGTNPGVRLTFRNNYNTEPSFDGGRLEISVNGGAFQEIITAGGSFIEGGYNGAIGATDSIFAGQPAWTGSSGGFITTTVVLPPSSYGQNAQLRWHTAYDTGTNPGGMHIDKVSIYAATVQCCSGACVITCPSTPIIVPNDPGQCGAIVTFPLPSYTGNCGTVTASPPSGSFFQVGTTTVTVTGRRLDGTFDTCTFNVVVNDTETPLVSAATVDKPVLWPPQHQMIPVTVDYTATDNCSVTCTLSVASNEPIDGLGDGDTAPDWIIVDNHHVQLRSERSGKGTGRIYTITVTCADPAGNTVTRTVAVRVPMNQSTK